MSLVSPINTECTALKGSHPLSLQDEEHRPPSIQHMELCALPHILLPLLLLLLVSPPPCASDQPTPHTPPSPPPSPLGGSAPVVTGRPFVVVWNMPTAHCQTLYGVQLNLGAFDIVVNSREHFDGQVSEGQR